MNISSGTWNLKLEIWNFSIEFSFEHILQFHEVIFEDEHIVDKEIEYVGPLVPSVKIDRGKRFVDAANFLAAFAGVAKIPGERFGKTFFEQQTVLLHCFEYLQAAAFVPAIDFNHHERFGAGHIKLQVDTGKAGVVQNPFLLFVPQRRNDFAALCKNHPKFFP